MMPTNTKYFKFYTALRNWEEGDILVRNRTKLGKETFIKVGLAVIMAVTKGKLNPVFVKAQLELEYEEWDLI